ncbi:imidazole glycerol phosphate synthase cyclase subunit [Akkermansiaceae bacterium]|nr:imidazole glycerol phosphate synthase cyclase subunit [Akkermansiaceae bacterium]
MRLIARLDIKPPNVVKPIHFEGLRIMGIPAEMAKRYYEDGADEITYIDIVSSLYSRPIQFDLAKDVSKDIFVPFAVGGGIGEVEHVKQLIHNGADKVIVNTNAIHRPELISEIAEKFGSQAVVVHIQAKRWLDSYECYTDCGRNRTGLDVVTWAKQAEELEAGEILLSVVDNDGRRRGYDLDIAEQVINAVNIPVVVGSGGWNLDHVLDLAKLNPSGIAVASMLHYEKHRIREIKQHLIDNGIELHNT